MPSIPNQAVIEQLSNEALQRLQTQLSQQLENQVDQMSSHRRCRSQSPRNDLNQSRQDPRDTLHHASQSSRGSRLSRGSKNQYLFKNIPAQRDSKKPGTKKSLRKPADLIQGTKVYPNPVSTLK